MVDGEEDDDGEEGDADLTSTVPGNIVDTKDLAMSRDACGRPIDRALSPI